MDSQKPAASGLEKSSRELTGGFFVTAFQANFLPNNSPETNLMINSCAIK